jgi:hypothetical protein
VKKKEPPASKRINVGVAALARETGLAEATISKKLKRGMSPEAIRAAALQRQGRMPVKGKLHTPGRGRPPLPSEYDMVVDARARYDEMETWKLRRAKALAERQEIENMLRRGELMPVTYARKWGLRFLIDGRDELLKGPSELADQLAAESDPLKVAAILRAWLERAIAKFEQLEMLWKGEAENEQVA